MKTSAGIQKISQGLVSLLLLLSLSAIAQAKRDGSLLKPVPANYQVKQALEIESLFPMFFTGGYHVGVGYRYNKFRVRVSVIDGGTYNAETAGVNNDASNFKRFYRPSPGVFLGYTIWKNLESTLFWNTTRFGSNRNRLGSNRI